jgi:hypothetical protein
VFRIRMAWLASVVAASLLAVMLLSVGGVAAKTPGWQFIDGLTGIPITQPCPPAPSGCQPSFTGSPTTVSLGAYVAFDVEIKNTGTSNISALTLTTDIPASNPMGNPIAVFDAVWTGQSGPLQPCAPVSSSVPLFCSFGALNAGSTVTVEIVFQAPTTAGSQAFNFLANGNGNTPSDSGGTSHGDTLKGPTSFTVSSSGDFKGGFQFTSGTISTNSNLSKKNDQSSSVTPPKDATAIPVTVQDNGPAPTNDPCQTLLCLGDWTYIQVGNHSSVGPIEVTLLIYGPSVPKGATLSNIGLWHDGTIITLPCSDPSSIPNFGPNGNECITVTTQGNNIKIDAWLLHNGGLKGTY